MNIPELGAVYGVSPIWFVDDSSAVWRREPVKSMWILARSAGGALRVKGRRLGGWQTAQFQTNADAPRTAVLEVSDPWHGGIFNPRREINREYAFVGSYVIYPMPGCWEFIASVQNHQVRIVRELH